MAAVTNYTSGTPWDNLIGTQLPQWQSPTAFDPGMSVGQSAPVYYRLPDGSLGLYDPRSGTINAGSSPQNFNGQTGYWGLKVDPNTGKVSGASFNTDMSGMSTLEKLIAAGAIAGTGAGMAGMLGGAGAAGSAVGGTMGGAGLVEPASGLGGAVAGGAASGAGTAAGAGTVAGLLSNPASLAAGANLVGGVLGSNAASDAAQQQQDAANAAIAEQRRQFDTTRSDLQPWMQAGQTSLSDLMANMNALTKPYTPADLQNDPGYQFQMSEGQKALDAAARARGGYGSSGALRELLRYSQGLASQSYGDAYNRDMASKLQKYNMLAGVSGTGQTTANNLGSFGSSNAQTVGDLLTQSGNAGAAGTVGSANAWNSALGNTVNAYQQQNWLNRIGSNLYGR